MYYKNIIVIGNGSLLVSCLQVIQSFNPGNISCIETEKQAFSNLESLCKSNNIAYYSSMRKTELETFFCSVDKPTLTFSIHNSFLFSKKILENKSLRIINFHNSLLPNHPGRNAPSWAIYEMEKKTGITWHEVVPEVDKGDIIIQKTIPINDSITAFDLTRICVNIGLQTFKEISPSLLDNDYKTTPQNSSKTFKMHYSHETPNDGILNMAWSTEKISAFLRSLDYGVLNVFEKPKVCFQNKWYSVNKYYLKNHPAIIGRTVSLSDNKLHIAEKGFSVSLDVTVIN